jgi:hypothetical protein
MERKTFIGIMNVAHDSGLYFSDGYKSLSPSYGVDNPVMAYRGLCTTVENVANFLYDKEHVTKEDLVQAFIKAIQPAKIIHEHRAHFENACDCLYYGYGFNTWNHKDLTDEEAEIIWRAAHHTMANAV